MNNLKRIVFPATNRVHESRQKLLLEELRKDFEVDVWKPKTENEGGLPVYSIMCSIEFNNFIAGKHYDGALIRADRFEQLHLAALCAYRGIPIIHLEGGCESGTRVIDSRIRHAITQLADIHFVTDEQAKKKVIYLGANPDRVFDVGSLDVSFAQSIADIHSIEEPELTNKKGYVLILHHSIPREDSQLVYDAVQELDLPIVGVKSNSDYKQSLMQEEYPPEEFLMILNQAKCVVGNSSAICKESSIMGTPAVLVGTRQDGRLVGHNVMRVPHDKEEIKLAIRYQCGHERYDPDYVYYKENTEQLIVEKLKQLL